MSIPTRTFEETMDIYAKPGTKVIFRARGGYDWQKERAKEAGFIVDQQYTVKRTEVDHSSTKVYFEEISDGWNSCLFADVPAALAAAGAQPVGADTLTERAEAIILKALGTWRMGPAYDYEDVCAAVEAALASTPRAIPAEQATPTEPRFTQYETNILNGVANWLDGRSSTVWAKEFGHQGLMVVWAKDLRDILAAHPHEAADRSAEANSWAELWYFVMDEAPLQFTRIVNECSPKSWHQEAHKLMRAKYPLAAMGTPAAAERCPCGYPMPCSTNVPVGFCKQGQAEPGKGQP